MKRYKRLVPNMWGRIWFRLKRVLLTIAILIAWLLGIVLTVGIIGFVWYSFLKPHAPWIKPVFIWVGVTLAVGFAIFFAYDKADELIFKYTTRKIHGNKPWWK